MEQLHPPNTLPDLLIIWKQLFNDARSHPDVIAIIKKDITDLISSDKNQNDIETLKKLSQTIGSCALLKKAISDGEDGYADLRNKLNKNVFQSYIETTHCWCGLHACSHHE